MVMTIFLFRASEPQRLLHFETMQAPENAGLWFERIEGSVSILRLGPVTMQCYALVTVSVKCGFDGLLALRRPRIEIPGSHAQNPEWCELGNFWIDADPSVPADHKSEWVIHPGQVLHATLLNHSKEIRNVVVAVDGDGVTLVHWALECERRKRGKDCPECRWKTRCRHDSCERSPKEAQRCAEARLKTIFREEGRITL